MSVLQNIPELTVDDDLSNLESARADYKVNGRAMAFFSYIDWAGNERTVGPQKTPVRIKYRDPYNVTSYLQMVINPVARKFVMLNTNEASNDLYGYEETSIAAINDARGEMQTIEFIDLNFEMPTPESVCSRGGAALALKFALILLFIICVLVAIGYTTYYVLVESVQPQSSG